jgi:hypothetical protein
LQDAISERSRKHSELLDVLVQRELSSTPHGSTQHSVPNGSGPARGRSTTGPRGKWFATASGTIHRPRGSAWRVP